MSKQFESAYDEIIETIDYNKAKEIVDHGCQSGVCSQYIYYADTIKFFDNGTEFLSNIFLANDCMLDMYKNDVTWCYVELICSKIVDEYESTTCEEMSDDPLTNLDALKELTNSSWGKDHLEIVNA